MIIILLMCDFKVSLKVFRFLWCSTFSEQREQTTHRLVAYKPGIKTMQNYKPSSQEAVTVACERYSFTRDSVIRLRVGKCCCFGFVLAYCAWLLSRGGRRCRFLCRNLSNLVTWNLFYL